MLPPPALTSARSMTGTRIGMPVPCSQRRALAPPPTSYSDVVLISPPSMRLTLAVVPPMSNEMRLASAELPAGERGGDDPGGRARTPRPWPACASAFVHREEAAARAHDVAAREAPGRSPRTPGGRGTRRGSGPRRRTRRWCWCARTRGSRAAPRRTGTRAGRAGAARSRAPMARSCASFEERVEEAHRHRLDVVALDEVDGVVHVLERGAARPRRPARRAAR